MQCKNGYDEMVGATATVKVEKQEAITAAYDMRRDGDGHFSESNILFSNLIRMGPRTIGESKRDLVASQSVAMTYLALLSVLENVQVYEHFWTHDSLLPVRSFRLVLHTLSITHYF